MQFPLTLERETLWQQIQARIPQMPAIPPEESIALRVLVQAMVIVGIVATDIAAETSHSLWALPLSIVGAVFSWYRRKEKNIPVKFLLAISMLGALGIFFRSLLGSPNDTRLPLAELLIYLQVIHSFDLPRRKDLGYSMVIGLVLLGVAANLSQTIQFAFALGLFTILAIPALALDYRSRIGLPPKKSTLKGGRSMALLWLAAMGLASIAFVLMPRLPGYQLRAFPVSKDLPFPKDFTPEQVKNPGYPTRKGNSQGKGPGNSKSGKDGLPDFDKTQYSGFNSEVDYNLHGTLEPAMMMRVRAQAPAFWRVMAFSTYTGKGWKLGSNWTAALERGTFQQLFYVPQTSTGLETREIVQTFSLVNQLPNLIPAATWAAKLYFPSPRVAVDREGAIRSPSILEPGTTYTVISNVPIRDLAILQKANRKYPKRVLDEYLQLPKGLDPQIAKLSRSVTEKFSDPYRKSLMLAQYLKQTYSIVTDMPAFTAKDDVVRTFLYKSKGGQAEHFATAMVVMLRSQGIPARLATGFLSGQYNAFTGYYEVYNTDATALVEVFFPGYGWLSFDPTPGRSLIPPSLDQAQSFGVAEQVWNALTSWVPASWKKALGDVTAFLLGSIVGFFALGAAWLSELGGVAALVVLAAIAVLGLIAWGLWQVFKFWREQRRLRHLDPVERVYQQALATLAKSGYPRLPQQTPSEFQLSLGRALPIAEPTMAHLTESFLAWRYRCETIDLPKMREQYGQLRKQVGGRKLKIG
jgi:protein-glutamine gamma-glutamyltransferase